MLRILHANEHPIMRVAIKALFEGYTPHVEFDEASNGDVAFEKIKKNEYDLIILDVSMPNIDSMGLISNILKIKPGSKILMFSEHTTSIYLKKYLQLGIMGYISRNMVPADIKNEITHILNNKKKNLLAAR